MIEQFYLIHEWDLTMYYHFRSEWTGDLCRWKGTPHFPNSKTEASPLDAI